MDALPLNLHLARAWDTASEAHAELAGCVVHFPLLEQLKALVRATV